MPGLIEFFPGFEVAVLTLPVAQLTPRYGIVPISGWSWWAVVHVGFTLDNTLGVAAARAQVQISSGGVEVHHPVASQDTAFGAAELWDFSQHMEGFGIAGSVFTAPLALIPNVDDGEIRASYGGGGPLTFVSLANAVIIGRRHQRKKKE